MAASIISCIGGQLLRPQNQLQHNGKMGGRLRSSRVFSDHPCTFTRVTPLGKSMSKIGMIIIATNYNKRERERERNRQHTTKKQIGFLA